MHLAMQGYLSEEGPCVREERLSGVATQSNVQGYRGTSLIRNIPPPKGFHRALGIVLLSL